MTLKVLTIDDSTTITTHLNYLLKNLKEIDWIGHAYDLDQGKKILKDTTPDVVLLDIMVREESGFDMLNFIKKYFPNVKVYMLSNLSDSIYVKRSLQLGASHFIDKSFEFESIPNLLLKEHQIKWNLN